MVSYLDHFADLDLDGIHVDVDKPNLGTIQVFMSRMANTASIIHNKQLHNYKYRNRNRIPDQDILRGPCTDCATESMIYQQEIIVRMLSYSE